MIKSKIMMSWSSQKKKKGILYTFHFVRRIFFHIFRIDILLHDQKRCFIHFLACL